MLLQIPDRGIDASKETGIHRTTLAALNNSPEPQVGNAPTLNTSRRDWTVAYIQKMVYFYNDTFNIRSADTLVEMCYKFDLFLRGR